MNLIHFSVKRPVATGVIYSFICAAGLIAWTQLPQEVMPDLNFPQLNIVTEYAQAAPPEIENLVTKPIEEAIGTVKNVSRIRSVSKEGTSIITVEFIWGTDMDFASLNVREKLDLVKNRLPSDVKEPNIVRYNPFHMPILIYSLSSQESSDPEFLSDIAQKTIANKIQKVEGVAAVQLSGVREKQFQVELDQTRLAANRVSLLQFTQSLSRANYKGAAGTAKEGSYDYSVRILSPFDSVEDIRSAIVGIDNPSQAAQSTVQQMKTASMDRQRQRSMSGDQRFVAVSHLGQVSDGFKERTSLSRFDGHNNITIMVQKQASASTVGTVKRVDAALDDIRPILPSDVSFTLIYDQANKIQQGIRDVLSSIFGGALLAFLVLLIFLQNWRDALVVSLVIPASVLLTIIAMKMLGMSLNTISMGGLALGIGMLVDASICVTENINRRFNDLNEPLEQAVIKGTEEVASAMASSNLTSIAVFLPLLFVLGLLGQLFRDLSLTVTITQVVSIVVSITLVPMMAKLMIRKKRPQEEGFHSMGDSEFLPTFAKRVLTRLQRVAEKYPFENIKTFYHDTVNSAFEAPKKVWAGILVAFALSLVLLKMIPFEFMPHVDADQLLLKLTMPNGTRLERTDSVMTSLEKECQQLADVAHITTTIGSSSDSALVLMGKNEGRILIDLKAKRKKSAEQSMAELRDRLSQLDLKGGRIELLESGGALSMAQGQTSPFMVYLKGYDLGKLAEASKMLKERLGSIEGVVQIRDSFSLPAPEVRLNIDKERAARLNLSVSDIARTAMTAYHGVNVTSIYREGKEISVRVRLQEQDRNNTAQLRSLLLPLQNGNVIPLADVASIDIGEGPSQIQRVDQERAVLVQADHSPEFSRSSAKAIQNLMSDFSYSDVTLELAGEKKAEQDSFRSLLIILVVSVLLVFMVMAVQFESLKQPFLILFSIPLSVIGMAIGLFVMGKTVNVVAGMGLLLLGGIVVNNGIVLIDFVNEQKKSDPERSLKDHLIHAGVTRLRPILLTATSTVVGLIPLALGIGEGAELQAPMAITVIFGLIASTGLTLVALPILFWLVEEKNILSILIKKMMGPALSRFRKPKEAL